MAIVLSKKLNAVYGRFGHALRGRPVCPISLLLLFARSRHCYKEASRSRTNRLGQRKARVSQSLLNFGFQRTLPHALGVVLGVPLVVALAVLGLGQVLASNAYLQSALHWIGAAYLLFLAYKIAVMQTVESEKPINQPVTFLQAFFFQMANPKNWVAVVALSGLVVVEQRFEQLLIIMLVFLFAALCSTSLWVLGGSMMSKLLREASHRSMMNKMMAVLLIGSLAPVYF